MWQIISCSLTGLLIIAVRNFQRFSNRSVISAYELVFVLKLDYTVNVTSKTQKDHHSKKFFLTISSTTSIRALKPSEHKEMYITRKILTN